MSDQGVKLGSWMPDEFYGGAPVGQGSFTCFTGGCDMRVAHVRPDRYRFWEKAEADTPLIPRGGGYSYAAASFGPGALTVEHQRFGRLLEFDSATGVLRAEAGATLMDVFNFLVPRGWYLPVMPGYPLITLGGCIAADVHGKHPAKDGTFRSQVRSMTLFHPDKGMQRISRDENADVFELTCGGYGLTGNIVDVELRAIALPSQLVRMRNIPIRGMDDFAGEFMEAARGADLAHSWHDFMLQGDSFGRGVIMSGAFLKEAGKEECAEKLRVPSRRNYLTPKNRGSWSRNFFTQRSTRLFNLAYYRLCTLKKEQTIALWDFTFPIWGYRQYYFKLFGRPGQIEYQAIVPEAAFGEYMAAVKRYLHDNPQSVTLGSAKAFAGKPGLVRYDMPGVSMSLDFPISARGQEFATFLDGLVTDMGGIPNIIKDYRLPGSVVAKAYPGFEEFRERLNAYDPKRMYRSELSERLGI